MLQNLTRNQIAAVFQKALHTGLIRKEDTAVMFHDLSFLEQRIRHLVSVFPGSALHTIAIKTNPLISILQKMKGWGTGLEAATIGEVHLALETGFKPEKIVFDSPVKTVQELEFAIHQGIQINIDNFSEMERIRKLLMNHQATGSFGIRINPQVGMGSIAETSVAADYSKFGIPIHTKRKELEEAFVSNTWLTGIHLHVGSQGYPPELLAKGVGIVYDFAMEINDTRNRQNLDPITIFDLGGGFPISYSSDLLPPSLESYVTSLRMRAPDLFRKSDGIREPWRMITEFGRWVHVNTGWTVSRIEYVKHDPEIHTAMIHTGADLFVRECLSVGNWKHEYTVMDRNGNLKEGMDEIPYNLAGPLCFSGDIIARAIRLPVVEEGDYLIIHDTGGYTFSMWSRYNSRLTPRILGYVNEGSHFEILKEREKPESICQFWR